MRAPYVGRVDADVLSKRQQQRLVGTEILKDSREKAGFGCGPPNALRINARKGQEPVKPRRVISQERQGLSCQCFGALPVLAGFVAL